jgi:kinetochore protein Spc7/SPC105
VVALRAELSEQTEQLDYLRGRLQEITVSKQEEANAYAKAQHFLEMKENSTRTEVFRLRGLCFYCSTSDKTQDTHR